MAVWTILGLGAPLLAGVVPAIQGVNPALQERRDAHGRVAQFILDAHQAFVGGGTVLSTDGSASVAVIEAELTRSPDTKVAIDGFTTGNVDSMLAQTKSLLWALMGGGYFYRIVSAQARALPGGRPGEARIRIRLLGRRASHPWPAQRAAARSAKGVVKPAQTKPTPPGPQTLTQPKGAPAVFPKAAAPKPKSTPVPAPAPKRPAPIPAAQSEVPRTWAVGLGYPDLRLRYHIKWGLAAEAKFAVEQGIQVYSGRFYYHPWSYRHFELELGAEAGWAHFTGPEIINGNGSYSEAFLALEYPLAGRFKLCVDAGPAWVDASSAGYGFRTTDLIVNTALYIYLF